MLGFVKRLLRLWAPKVLPCGPELVVLVTGCDSGLGFQIARIAQEKGLTVIAGLYEGPQGAGGRRLKQLTDDAKNLHLLKLDVTEEDSVNDMKVYIQKLLRENPNYLLHAVVNNAGVMVMGEFEWQTQKMLENQLAVNVLGPWQVSKALLGVLRRAAARGGAPRLLNVGSHCGMQPLKTMAAYSGTKAAMRAWAEALRMELRYYGVHVVTYVPGNMIASTNLLVRQVLYFEEMKNAMDEEQRVLYGNYLGEFQQYIQMTGIQPKDPNNLIDKVIENTFMAALLEEQPKHQYLNEPWRYTFYYNLFKISPMFLKFYLIEKFLMLPKYNKAVIETS